MPGDTFFSLVQLVANPEKYDGKRVAVIGFLKLQFEGNELFIHRDDWENGISKNGVWVDVNSAVSEHAEELNEHYVLIVGTFSATNKGHMGMASGSIASVCNAVVWPVRGATARRPCPEP